MLPPPFGERGGYPHSCCRELPNDFEKEGFNRAGNPIKKGKDGVFDDHQFREDPSSLLAGEA
jgi:hypothetical protein